MKRLIKKSVVALLMVCASSAAWGQAAPTPVGHASVASVDAVQKAATDMGIPAPSLKELIEGLPFMAKDALDTTKPAGRFATIAVKSA